MVHESHAGGNHSAISRPPDHDPVAEDAMLRLEPMVALRHTVSGEQSYGSQWRGGEDTILGQPRI